MLWLLKLMQSRSWSASISARYSASAATRWSWCVLLLLGCLAAWLPCGVLVVDGMRPPRTQDHSTTVRCYSGINQVGCGSSPSSSSSYVEMDSIAQCCLEGTGHHFRKVRTSPHAQVGGCEECVVFGLKLSESSDAGQISQLQTAEQHGGGARYTVYLTAVKGSISRNILFNIVATSGTAGTDDYSLTTTSILLTPSTPVGAVELEIADDSIALEGNEFFTISAESSVLSENEFTDSSVTVWIEDNSEVALEFAETLYRAREGIPSVGVVIVGTGSIAHELTFRVVPRTFSEYSPLPVQTNLFASSKEDFVGGGLNVTFDPSSPSVGGGGASGSPLGEVVVEIGVVDDEINEADEGFLVAIELISHAHKSFVNLSHRSLVLVKIVDNDPIFIGFQFSSFYFKESNAMESIYLMKENGRESQQTLTVEITQDFGVGNPATAGVDFILGAEFSGPVTFLPSEQHKKLTFQILDDDIVENPEQFRLRVLLPEGSPTDLSAGSDALITIVDNDELTLGFENQTISVVESVGSFKICAAITDAINTDSQIEILLYAYPTPGTADVSDYEDMSYVLYFSATHTRDCLQVAIVDDSRYEGKETFQYALDLYSENLPHVEIEPAFVWIDILNDDDPTAPEITQPPLDTVATLDERIVLSCLVQGSPDPSFAWTRDGQALPEANSSRLVIASAGPADRGFYTCTASNIVSSVSATALVTLKDVFQYTAVINTSSSNQEQEKLLYVQLNTSLSGQAVPFTANTTLYSIGAVTGTRGSILVTLLSSDPPPEIARGLNALLQSVASSLDGPGGVWSFFPVLRFDGCLGEDTAIMNGSKLSISWPEAGIGTQAVASCPCSPESHAPLSDQATRTCGGTFAAGGQWEQLKDQSVCRSLHDNALKLCETTLLGTPKQTAGELLEIVSEGGLEPKDVSVAVTVLSSLVTTAAEDEEVREMFLDIADELLMAGEEVILSSQEHSKSSTQLVEALDHFLESTSLPKDSAMASFGRSNFELQAVEQPSEDYHGISFAFSDTSSMSPQPQGSHELSTGDGATVTSIHLPNSLLEEIAFSGGTVRFTSLKFTDDILFQPRPFSDEFLNYSLGGVVISASVVDSNPVQNLAEPIKIFFPRSVVADNESVNSATCVFYDTTLDGGFGGWSTEGCQLTSNDSDMYTCECNHLTSFTILLDVSPSTATVSGDVLLTISIVTYVGLGVSILCLSIIIITYLTSRKLRASGTNQLLINLSGALLGLYISFICAAKGSFNAPFCSFLAVLVHYFFLAYFFWTASEAVYLYLKLVKVLVSNSITDNYSLISIFVCWISPVFIVVISLAGHSYYGNEEFCRPYKWPFYFGFLAPFVIIYAFNWVMFLVIMASLIKHYRKLQGSRSIPSHAEDTKPKRNPIWKHFFIAVILAILFGLGWGAGLLGTSALPSYVHVPAQYIFSIFTGMQGVLIFLLHGLRSPEAREEWKRWWLRVTCSKLFVDQRRGSRGLTNNMAYSNSKVVLTQTTRPTCNPSEGLISPISPATCTFNTFSPAPIINNRHFCQFSFDEHNNALRQAAMCSNRNGHASGLSRSVHQRSSNAAQPNSATHLESSFSNRSVQLQGDKIHQDNSAMAADYSPQTRSQQRTNGVRIKSIQLFHENKLSSQSPQPAEPNQATYDRPRSFARGQLHDLSKSSELAKSSSMCRFGEQDCSYKSSTLLKLVSHSKSVSDLDSPDTHDYAVPKPSRHLVRGYSEPGLQDDEAYPCGGGGGALGLGPDRRFRDMEYNMYRKGACNGGSREGELLQSSASLGVCGSGEHLLFPDHSVHGRMVGPGFGPGLREACHGHRSGRPTMRRQQQRWKGIEAVAVSDV